MQGKRLLTNRFVLAIIIVLLASAVLNLLRNINSTQITDEQGKPYVDPKVAKTPDLPNKTFTSDNLGIKFTYPNEWQVKQGFSAGTGIAEKPAISVSSPNGTTINLDPNLTLSYPLCEQNIYDKPHNTLACNTIEVLSRQKTNLKSPEGDVYIVRALYTPPRSNGSSVPAKSKYIVFLSSDKKLANSQEPLVGNWPDKGSVMLSDAYLTVDISGLDNFSKDFFKSTELKTAEQILSSVENYN